MIFRRKKQPQPGLLFSSLIVLLILALSGCGQSASSSNSGTDTQSQDGTTQDGSSQGGSNQGGSTNMGNHQPSAKITAPQSVISGETVTLDGSGSSDSDGSFLSYQWTKTSGPDITFSNTTASSLSFVAPSVDQTEQISFQLTVRDSDGLSNSTSVSIQILPSETPLPSNQAPSAQITAPQSVTSGETVTLDGSGSSDPDGDTITYLWTQTQGDNITLANSTDSTLSFVAPTVQQSTSYTFQLSVSDGSLSDSSSVQFIVLPVATDPASTGLHVSGTQILDSNDNAFIMRGINVAHAWYPDNTSSSLSDIANTGANTVRIVLSSGDRWNKTTESMVSSLIEQAKANKLIAILEVHDTTGYGEEADAITLSQAADYWKSIKGALIGQEDYAVIDIGNEPLGNGQPASAWIDGHINAIKSLRDAGLKNAIMVDAANWGQDWKNIMRDNAISVLAADPQKNVIFSVHMYQIYKDANSISNYMASFVQNDLALVVGEFGADHQGENVDEASIMSYATQYGYGYLGWSWSGNSGGTESLDIVNNFDATSLSSWGETLINGNNGIKATSQIARVFSGSTDPTANNQAPSAKITAPQSATSGETVTLDGSASSDPDGDTLSYQWTKTAGPNFTLSNTTGSSLSFVAPSVAQSQQVSFQLTVSDGELSNSSSVSMQISPIVDNSAPSIVSRFPQVGQSGVSPSAQISVSFNEALLESSVTSQSLVVTQNGNPVPGSVSYGSNSNSVTFQSASALSGGVSYTVTLAQSLTDVAGNAFAGASWSFTTGVCGTADENAYLTLTCPSGQVINEVTFASYGTPGGSCGSFTTGTCNASNSDSVVLDACKGMDICILNADNGTFGDPCSGTTKKLSAQVACGMPTDPTPTPDTGSGALVVAVNAGGQSTTYNGVSYEADNYYSNGSSYSTTADISGTNEDGLFQSERYGTFSYSIPVTAASYSLKLHFAEIYFTSAGQRLFNVKVEGNTVLTDIDLYTLAGANGVYTAKVNNVPVSDGSLDISIEGVTGDGKISGFSVFSSDGKLNPVPAPDNNTGVTSLKSLASFPIGVAVNAGNEADSIISSGTSAQQQAVVLPHFSQMTAGNIMKMSYLHPSENSYTFDQADAFVSFAAANGLTVHAHTLIWHSDYQVPSFMKNYSGDFAAMLKTHVQTIATHFAGKVDSWDVVNEALAENGDGGAVNGFRNSVFYQKMGVNFIDQAFINAHAADPDADLFYNDFNIENGDAKTTNLLSLIDGLKARNVPISGVGFQMHVMSDWPNISTIEAAMKAVADRGLKVKISELDVRVNNPYNPSATVYASLTAEAAAKQKERYRQIVAAYLRAVPPALRAGITVWGVWDTNSWLNTAQNPDWPLLFDDNFQAKPALQGFVDGLTGK